MIEFLAANWVWIVLVGAVLALHRRGGCGAPMTAAAIHHPAGVAVGRRSLEWGVTAATVLALFYALVVGFASGSADHLIDQARRDWYFLAPIIVGFGTQVTLVVELRRRHRLSHGALAAGGTGAGASTVGIVACCAHHLADLLPVLGATGAAAFLLDLRIPFMVAGIAVNAVGIAAAARRLRHMGPAQPEAPTATTTGHSSCAAA